ncbi:MAG: DUF4215 domain-containing protein [Deltaproteobacteria bacterium]|jgi:cysteine-rich repeat protein|nr:DUF4215 domain-containing protein [Deltaproteobacteria bacterium]
MNFKLLTYLALTILFLTIACDDDNDSNNTNNINNVNNVNNENCGNDFIEGDEVCDGTALDENDCTTIGENFVGGILACNQSCDAWDTSKCTSVVSECGNDLIDGDEVCDSTNLDGYQCIDIDPEFLSGTLACSDDCLSWDTENCSTEQPVLCGDGIVDETEQCDDANTEPNDGCNEYCEKEPGWACYNPEDGPSICSNSCGDGIIVEGEICDDLNVMPDDGCSPSCEIETGWECNNDEPSICTTNCGDQIVVGSEVCDGTNLNGQDCTTIEQGFTGGTLSCKNNCTWATNSCTQ